MNDHTEVLYNDACPVCRREVTHYARITERTALPITFDDLGNPAELAKWQIAPEEAAKRLHVRKEGQIYAGIPAFVVLWREIPQYRWLAKCISLPGVHWLACKVYDHILAPTLFAWHKRRQSKS